MKHVLLIGLGQVGTPLRKIEKDAGNKTYVIDPRIDSGTSWNDFKGVFDVTHICIPYSKKLVQIVSEYAKKHATKLIIIHSTVPVGTTDEVKFYTDTLVVHSPIRGVHPHLYKGIKTFVKYVGGDKPDINKACKHLTSIGLEVKVVEDARTTELGKILSTTYYGWNILFAKQVKGLCDFYGLEYDDVYTHFNKTYNKGFTKVGKHNVVRPILSPPEGEIGGHCIVPNFDLLPYCIMKKVVKKLNRYKGL